MDIRKTASFGWSWEGFGCSKANSNPNAWYNIGIPKIIAALIYINLKINSVQIVLKKTALHKLIARHLCWNTSFRTLWWLIYPQSTDYLLQLSPAKLIHPIQQQPYAIPGKH